MSHTNNSRTPSSQHRHRVAVLDAMKMHKLFYEAGWWMAQAQNTQNLDVSAFDDNFLGRLVHHVVPWNLSDTETAAAPRIDHDADALANQMQTAYADILCDQGTGPAKAFLAQKHATRDDAQRRVMAAYTAADNHNARIAQLATKTATVLSDTILVCEVALAVGTCVLSFGAAPAFLAGGAAASTQIAAGMAISTGYGIASVAVDHSEDNLSAVGIDQTSNWANAANGHAVDVAKEARRAEILKQTKTVSCFNATVNRLQKKLAQQITSGGRATAQRQLVKAIGKSESADRDLRALKDAETGLRRAGKAVPLIQCGVDLIVAFKGEHDRLESLGVDFWGNAKTA